MTSRGIEYPIWVAVWVSPTSFLWKLTLSLLNPGQHTKIIHSARGENNVKFHGVIIQRIFWFYILCICPNSQMIWSLRTNTC